MKHTIAALFAALSFSAAHAQSAPTSYPVGTVFGDQTPTLANGTQCRIATGLASLYQSPTASTALLTLSQGLSFSYPQNPFTADQWTVQYGGAARLVFASATATSGIVVFDSFSVTDLAHSSTQPPAPAKIFFHGYSATLDSAAQTMTVKADLQFVGTGNLDCTVPVKLVFHTTG